MKDDGLLPLLIFILSCVICAGLGWAGGEARTKRVVRLEAVKAGVAEFRATPEGDVEFHWKGPAK